MAWEGIKKSESYTFRMKPPVWAFIQQFAGTGRNEKLENIINFTYFERDSIQEEIDYLQKRREKLTQEIQKYEEMNDQLESIQSVVNDLLYRLYKN